MPWYVFKVKVVTRYADIIPLRNILITFLQMFITVVSVVDVKDWLFSASIKHKQNILYNSGQILPKVQQWNKRLFLRAEWVGC